LASPKLPKFNLLSRANSLFVQVSATRLKCLLIFSVERSWCAVVRKLFDITFTGQNIGTGIARLSQVVQDDHSLLHRAVRRMNRGMVELLLAYVPSSIANETIMNAVNTESLGNLMQFKLQWGKLFRPDMTGPAGLTPLHIAASMQGGEDIVDALTSDPLQVRSNYPFSNITSCNYSRFSNWREKSGLELSL
jgi:ankyrin repeat protein